MDLTGTRRKTRKATSWGYHLMINAGGCDPVALRSKSTIAAFAKALVKGINMVAFGAPRIVHFGSGHTKGYTLIQLIETSDITAHFVEGANEIYLDVFSCKSFRKADAVAIFKEFFHPGAIETVWLKRAAPYVPAV